MARARLSVVLGLLAVQATAWASTADVFGLGSEEAAVCGASAARVHDFSAGYYDPAGLTQVLRPEASFGVLGFGSQLGFRDGAGSHEAPMSDPVGILIGAATPIPFTG